MRSSTSLALFVGSAAAQSMSTGSLGASSGVTIFNLFEYASTLTLVGSDATATTYKNDCPASGAGLPSILPSSALPTASAIITPAPKPRALRARQAITDSSDDVDVSLCEPYTIKQGASTWEMHLTDPSPGVWTVDMNCKWQGAMTSADFTCTAVVDGSYVDASDRGTTTTIMPSSFISDFEAMNTVAVVDASKTPLSSGATPSASASSASGSGPSGSGASASGASGSGSGAAAPTPSTGFAPAGPLPTGAMALVGGAAGMFAAALAL